MAVMDWRGRIEGALTRSWGSVREALLAPQGAAPSDEKVASLASQAAPVIWLLGKVQSGKTSIVRALTEATAAEVGLGYKPCTRTAEIFDFRPRPPAIRFLDTRGLGEKGYDPTEDIALHQSQSHLVIAVMKALDPQQDAVLEATKAARKRHPDWPVIVAQTSLHEAYAPGGGHRQPYPFGSASEEAALPPALSRGLNYQRSLFATLPGNGAVLFVPLDFTQASDGFSPPLTACLRSWQHLRRHTRRSCSRAQRCERARRRQAREEGPSPYRRLCNRCSGCRCRTGRGRCGRARGAVENAPQPRAYLRCRME